MAEPKTRFLTWLERHWYGRRIAWPFLLLQPVYFLLGMIRRLAYRRAWLASWRAPVPVLVVGNLSVGGTGKTPLTIALVEAAQAAGLRPGVVSRGYGRDAKTLEIVSARSTAAEVGDEPLLIFQRTLAPVAVASTRKAAAEALLENVSVNFLIADDGLQHYALARDVECVVVDSRRGFGNGWQLPCGPLREPMSRLTNADALVINQRGGDFVFKGALRQVKMALQGANLHNLVTQEVRPLSQFSGQSVAAIAGIGHPEVFFEQLKQAGLTVSALSFLDHHQFVAEDLPDASQLLIMTEKDAVKIAPFAHQNCWYLPVTAELPKGFLAELINTAQTRFAQTQKQ